jgi:hypothetical protein
MVSRMSRSGGGNTRLEDDHLWGSLRKGGTGGLSSLLTPGKLPYRFFDLQELQRK